MASLASFPHNVAAAAARSAGARARPDLRHDPLAREAKAATVNLPRSRPYCTDVRCYLRPHHGRRAATRLLTFSWHSRETNMRDATDKRTTHDADKEEDEEARKGARASSAEQATVMPLEVAVGPDGRVMLLSRSLSDSDTFDKTNGRTSEQGDITRAPLGLPPPRQTLPGNGTHERAMCVRAP